MDDMDEERSGSRWEPTDEEPTRPLSAQQPDQPEQPAARESLGARLKHGARRVPVRVAMGVTALALVSASGGYVAGRAVDDGGPQEVGFSIRGGDTESSRT